MNKHISDYLDYYVNLEVSPNYAVMITGEWGAGKSFFVTSKIKSYGTEIKAHYISLYGLSSTAQIDELVFASLHPILGSKAFKVGSRLLAGAFKFTTTIGLDLNAGGSKESEAKINIPEIDLSELISDDHSKPKSLFVFDDFERCSIKPKELLGYINYYVEHLGAKVILISNDSKINDVEYRESKEKIIGQECTIVPDFDKAFEALTLVVNDSECKQVLNLNKSEIKTIFEESKCHNLRALRHSFLQFKRLYSNLPEKAKQAPEYLTDLIHEFYPLALEHFRGFDLSTLSLRMYLEDKSTIEQSFSQYSRFDLYKVLSYQPHIWTDFIKKGRVNKELLNAKVDSHPLFLTDTSPNWIKLWNWRTLTTQEFHNLIEIINTSLDSQEISEVGEILHIFGIQMLLINAGFSFADMQSLYKQALQYAESVKPKLTYNVFAEADLGLRSYLGYGYPSEIPLFDDLFVAMVEWKRESVLSTYPQEAARLLDLLRIENNSGVYEYFYHSGQYAKFPVFKHVIAQDVMNVLQDYKTNDQWHNFSLCLKGRKDYLMNYQQNIEEEAPFYLELKGLLYSYYEKNKSNAITSIGVMSVIKSIEKIVNDFDDSTNDSSVIS